MRKPTNPPLFVAGILSPDGGRRVVCTEAIGNYVHHVGPGERCFIVPDYRVPDPIPHKLWSAVVLAADHNILRHIARERPNEDMYFSYLDRLKNGDIGERASWRRFQAGEFS